jgi:hypothetical protein
LIKDSLSSKARANHGESREGEDILSDQLDSNNANDEPTTRTKG